MTSHLSDGAATGMASFRGLRVLRGDFKSSVQSCQYSPTTRELDQSRSVAVRLDTDG